MDSAEFRAIEKWFHGVLKEIEHVTGALEDLGGCVGDGRWF